MPRWLPRLLRHIAELAAARKVLFTLKARRELAALDFGIDQEDACDLLENLTAEDLARRLVSAATGEWMYVFKPILFGSILYVKLILRTNCIVVSLHEDESAGHEEDDA